MVQVRIKLNSDGIRALLQGEEVQGDLQRRVDAITDAAGGEPDFEGEVEVVQGSSKLGRAMGYVRTASTEGRRAEAENRALTRAIDAGR